MIIIVRGTNGSGKSHAVRKILSSGQRIGSQAEGSALIRLPRVKQSVLVIGPYEYGRSMGGCDCIRQPSKIYRLIDLAIHEQWHVLLEGVVLATKPYFTYHNDGVDVRYAFLDPPMSVCLTNIKKRQERKGQISHVSRSAMKRKWTRAYDMYEHARDAKMITTHAQSADDITRWISYQLRRP